MLKKKNAVMVADTRTALVGTTLINLQETNPGLFDEAIVYHQGIAEQDKAALEKIMPCRFVEYKPPLPESVLRLENFARFSVLMFPRYEMFCYLDEFETVTWTDTDVIIKGDLSPLLDKAREHGFVANFENPEDCTNQNTDSIRSSFHSFHTIPEKYDMDCYNMCSGLIVVSDKLTDTKKYTDWCYQKTIEYAEDLNSPDQGVLNLFIQEFNIDAVSAGEHGAYCVFPYYKRDTGQAKIVHSWGLRKFWNSWYLYNEYPAWGEYYRKWLALGGTDSFGEFKPGISVVIPSYKPDIRYLRQVLDCLLIHQVNAKQPWIAFDDLEVILVLEPVETGEVEKLVAEYDDRRLVLHINESRRGIAKSLNTGIRLAKSDYILRMDDDDLCADTRLYKQKAYLETHPDVELVTSDYEYFGDMNERRVSFEGEVSRAWSLVTCPFDHPTVMFRKSFFAGNGLCYDEDRGYVEDWELWLRAFGRGMRVGCIHEVLFYHRWHNGSAGQNDNTPRMMRELVKKNFAELGVDIPDAVLPYVAPWQGKIVDTGMYAEVLRIYARALELNVQKKRYEQEALSYIFSLRLQEAATGRIDALVSAPGGIPEKYRERSEPAESMEHHESPPVPAVVRKTAKQRIKGCIKHIARPFYGPVVRYIQRQKRDLVEEIHRAADGIRNEVRNELMQMRTEGQTSVDKAAEWIAQEVVMSRDAEMKLMDTIAADSYKAASSVRFLQRTQLPRGKAVFLFGTPEYSNIGDAAINLGERAWLCRFYPDRAIVELSTYDFASYYPEVARMVGQDDIIFLQGGGNMGSRYLNEENVRRRVISDFPENRIVIMPQTVYYEDAGELEKSMRIYAAHRKLTVLARGSESLSFIKKWLPKAKSACAFDMALNIRADYSMERKGILLCIRGLDDESGLTRDRYEAVIQAVRMRDPDFVQTNNLNEGKTDANIFREPLKTHFMLFYSAL